MQARPVSASSMLAISFVLLLFLNVLARRGQPPGQSMSGRLPSRDAIRPGSWAR